MGSEATKQSLYFSPWLKERRKTPIHDNLKLRKVLAFVAQIIRTSECPFAPRSSLCPQRDWKEWVHISLGLSLQLPRGFETLKQRFISGCALCHECAFFVGDHFLVFNQVRTSHIGFFCSGSGENKAAEICTEGEEDDFQAGRERHPLRLPAQGENWHVDCMEHAGGEWQHHHSWSVRSQSCQVTTNFKQWVRREGGGHLT